MIIKIIKCYRHEDVAYVILRCALSGDGLFASRFCHLMPIYPMRKLNEKYVYFKDISVEMSLVYF